MKLWDVRSGQELQTLKGHAKEVFEVAFAPDGKTLVSGGGHSVEEDFSLRLWRAATDEEVARQRNR